jgi:hypothetical protein
MGTGCGFAIEYIGIAAADEKLPKLGQVTRDLVRTHCVLSKHGT